MKNKMKKLFLTMAVVASMVIVGCNDDDTADLENDVRSLQDSLSSIINQHNALLDSISYLIATVNEKDIDVKSLKMEQIGSLFEAIARQPEAAEVLINATEILYSDYTELLPFSDRTIEARGMVIYFLSESIARQPEACHLLDSAATKFLGEFNPSYMSNYCTEGRARGYGLSGLFESIARQPESFNKLDSIATKYLGEYNPSYFSDELLEISKITSSRILNESIARQPQADSLLNLVCVKYLNFDFMD